MNKVLEKILNKFELALGKFVISKAEKEFNKGLALESETITSKEKARKHIKNAARMGYIDAQIDLGRSLSLEGEESEAMYWFEKAAEKGSSDAQNNLASLLEREGNIEEAKKWYKKAAAQNCSRAQYKLGKLFEKEGKRSTAQYWHRKAANNGLSTSISILKEYQLEKEETRKRIKAEKAKLKAEGERKKHAKKLLLEAAKQNNSTAQYEVGTLLLKEGKEKQAIGWLFKAACQRNEDACTDLVMRIGAEKMEKCLGRKKFNPVAQNLIKSAEQVKADAEHYNEFLKEEYYKYDIGC